MANIFNYTCYDSNNTGFILVLNWFIQYLSLGRPNRDDAPGEGGSDPSIPGTSERLPGRNYIGNSEAGPIQSKTLLLVNAFFFLGGFATDVTLQD